MFSMNLNNHSISNYYIPIMKKTISIKGFKRLLEQARAEIKSGKVYTHQQVKAKLRIK